MKKETEKKLFKLAAFWETEAKSGFKYHKSQKFSFGELRNLVKQFKDEENVADTDTVQFLLFPVKKSTEKSPYNELILKKSDKKGEYVGN